MEVKYNYQNISVYRFCKINGLIYKNTIGSILYYTKRYQKYAQNKNETIDMVIKKQFILTERKIKKNAFLDVLNDKINIAKVSKILNINTNSIYKVRNYGFSTKEAIIIIYFLADCGIKDRRISTKKIQQTLSELQNKNYTNDYAHLFCYYYLGCNTIVNIIGLVTPMLKNNIYSVSNYYCIKMKEYDFEDIMNSTVFKILEMIKERKILLNESGQIKSYIYKSAKEKIYAEMKEIKIHSKEAHFEDEIGENRTLMDVISSKYNW